MQTKTQVQTDRQAALEAKRAAHIADSSNPALTPAEQDELAELKKA